MDMEETIQREHEEYEKAAAARQRQEAKRAEKEAMKPPTTAQAQAQGLSEAEMRAKIMAFMCVSPTILLAVAC